MRNGKYDVLSPLYSGEPVNEAEVLGAVVWLWMHSPLHRDAPLHTLPDLLLPVIKNRQYVVATEQGRPVFFMSQACSAWMQRRVILRSRQFSCLSRTGTAATGCGSVTGLPLSGIPRI